jgi:hypothetical protein
MPAVSKASLTQALLDKLGNLAILKLQASKGRDNLMNRKHPGKINYDGCEKLYRQLYWEVNELEIVGSDAPDQDYLRRVIEGKEATMRTIVANIGYTPAA